MGSRCCVFLLAIYLTCTVSIAVQAYHDLPTSIGSLPIALRKEETKPEATPSTFDQFAIEEITPQEASMKRTTVFAKGKFCPDRTSTEPKASCLLPDMHVDRTWFQFRYAFRNNDSAVGEPLVSAIKTNNSVITPTVNEYRVAQDGTGSFTVFYGCTTKGTNRVRLVMNVTKTKTITMTWNKICGSGVNEFVSLKPNGLSDTGDGNLPLESGPTQESTTVDLVTKFPQSFIKFKKPYLTSSRKDITVSLRGHVQGGDVSSSPKTFKIFYDCKSRTTSQITLTVAIPPWNNVTLGWTKNCGGSTPSALIVLAGKEPVYNETGVASKFKVTDTTTLRKARSSGIFELDSEHSLMKFDIENIGKGSLELQGFGVTVSSQNILSVSAEDNSGLLSEKALMANSEITIRSKRTTTLSLRCICLARGAAVVLVTLPIHGYKKVEFGFYKDCKRPHVYHHSGFFTTAPSLLFIFICAVIVGGAFAYRYYRNRTQGTSKYTLVRAVSG